MTSARETFGGVTLACFGPLMIVRFDRGWTTSDFGKAMERLLALAPRRFAVMSEMRKVKPAGALERKSMSAQLTRFETEINERVVVSIVVSDSMLTRGAIRAIRWLNPPRYPVLTFESPGGAIQECLTRLAEERIAVAPEDAAEAELFAKNADRDSEGRTELG